MNEATVARAGGRSGYVVFRPRARLLKLIGAELISDEIVAITELVKNAHDADAENVTIRFEGVTAPEGTMTVTDDGCGMDLETVLGRWMEPAGSAKGELKARITSRGRRVLGEKGVGRFAADKLGRYLELISRGAGARDEIRAVFDWDAFDTGTRMLSDIRNRWELRSPSLPQSGTTLRVSALRAVWSERLFRRLTTRLSRLQSPFGERDAFRIRIESDEFPHYAGDVRSDVLERAPYRVEAAFDGSRMIAMGINGARPVDHPWNGAGDLQCGPVRIRLFAFDLETEALARIGPRTDVRGWLREWSGISVYRDGFRVWPYGEPHDDWLRLDQRRVNNPVVRLSNNQVVGFVEIARDRNPDLRDQTNREGLLHNRAFEDLRRLMYFVLQVLEAERQSLRHPRTTTPPGHGQGRHTSAATIAATVERLAKRVPALSKDLHGIGRKFEEQVAREDQRVQRLEHGYAELAALGQAAAGFSVAIAPFLEQLEAEARHLRSIFKGVKGLGIDGSLGSVERACTAIRERVAMLAPMETERSRRRRTIDVATEIQSWGSLLKPVLQSSGVRLKIVPEGQGLVRTGMLPENFHRILHMLASNALDWLHSIKDPEIRVVVRRTGRFCAVTFSDNGPGIPPRFADQVFEPLFSRKEGGRGMGLTIARRLMRDHGGDISALVDGRRRGASLRLTIPLSRTRATVHRA